MTTVYDVPADLLINKVAKDLEEMENIAAPDWADFVKTGVNKERRPQRRDWWYVRSAALLRKVYTNGPVGISSLRTVYGGKKNRGSRPEKFTKSSGAIIRNILKQLEAEGLVEKVENGRVATPKGKSFLDNASNDLIKDIPELEKYQ